MRVKKVKAADLHTLVDMDWVDRSRRPYRKGDTVYVPVTSGYPYDLSIPGRRRRGRGYQRLGDTVVFHGNRPEERDIHDVMVREEPACILFIPGHTGSLRVPSYEVIFGTPHEVLHRECGISYWLDPTKVMFSQGNRGEKERIASLIRSSGNTERIADMFAGIGYFTLMSAAAGGMVHAMEMNYESYAYLLKNIQANELADRIQADCGDCRDHLSGSYDRVIMGHFDAACYLPDALSHIRSDGTLHLHTICPDEEAIKNTICDYGFDAQISVHRVKKYAPQIWHYVLDVVVV